MLVFRNIVSAFAATRYLTSLIVMIAVLAYGSFTLLERFPVYTDLARQLGLAPAILMAGLYIVVAIITTVIWYVSVLASHNPDQAQRAWREVYRQTDGTGLLWLDLTTVAVAVATAFFMSGSPVSDTIDFLAVVVCIPALVDILPTQRPRRVVIPDAGSTPQEVASNTSAGLTSAQAASQTLDIYNDVPMETLVDEHGELPKGLVIEIPPRG